MISIKNQLANSITLFRIAVSLLLLFSKPLSICYFVLYTLAGISDMCDGYVARMTQTQSRLGAFLDSLADIIFLLAVLFSLFPILTDVLSPIWLIPVVIIAGIRLTAFLIGALRFHCIAAYHTISNKITGLFLFLLPYLLHCRYCYLVCGITCIFGIYAAIEELYLNVRTKTFQPDRKSIFQNE